MDKSIRFLYIQDQEVPDRTVTIARIREGNKLKFSWSMNRVSTLKIDSVICLKPKVKSQYKRTVVHEEYNKEKGKLIASQRLLDSDVFLEVELAENARPVSAVLEKILCSPIKNPFKKREADLVEVPIVLNRIISQELLKWTRKAASDELHFKFGPKD